ncbi:MAG TPA: copper chaperone PCu(A)C [Steroidobacteraceae bacterium]|nr:copper chaperone PCu(A)C [Steroidobacteraceae bacterium]
MNRHTDSVRVARALLGLAGVAALLLSGPVGAAVAAPALRIENAWISQPPPGSDIGAAYFTLHNTGTRGVAIIDVDCPLASAAMLHESRVVAGQSQMRPVERLEVAPGASRTLAPGGLHVMLHGLKRRLIVGESVPLVLKLEDGTHVSLTARVRPPGSH